MRAIPGLTQAAQEGLGTGKFLSQKAIQLIAVLGRVKVG